MHVVHIHFFKLTKPLMTTVCSKVTYIVLLQNPEGIVHVGQKMDTCATFLTSLKDEKKKKKGKRKENAVSNVDVYM